MTEVLIVILRVVVAAATIALAASLGAAVGAIGSVFLFALLAPVWIAAAVNIDEILQFFLAGGTGLGTLAGVGLLAAFTIEWARSP